VLHRLHLVAGLCLTTFVVAGSAHAGQIHSAPKKKHTAAQAQKVVKSEIADRYLVYGQFSPDKPVKRTASCSALTSTLFKCTWMAESEGTTTFGKAKVKFYSKGNEATFSDVSCGPNYDNPDEVARAIAADRNFDADPPNR
jgi:hypothetical protein